jgi:hypothetical protein
MPVIQTTIGDLAWGLEGTRAGHDEVSGEPMGIVKTAAREGRFVFWGATAGDRNKRLVDGAGIRGLI